MALSTIKASSTRIFPPTVNTMQVPIKIAIKTDCQSSNGGKTAFKESSIQANKQIYTFLF